MIDQKPDHILQEIYLQEENSLSTTSPDHPACQAMLNPSRRPLLPNPVPTSSTSCHGVCLHLASPRHDIARYDSRRRRRDTALHRKSRRNEYLANFGVRANVGRLNCAAAGARCRCGLCCRVRSSGGRRRFDSHCRRTLHLAFLWRASAIFGLWRCESDRRRENEICEEMEMHDDSC